MDFTQVVNDFLDANSQISRDERNLALIVGYINKCGVTVTPESAPVLLEAFVRTHHDKILWLAESQKDSLTPAQMWAKQNKAYNPVEELAKSHEKAKQKREEFHKQLDLAARRKAFVKEMRNIYLWQEHRGNHIDYAATFNTQKAKYEALKKTFPEWSVECDAAATKVGK